MKIKEVNVYNKKGEIEEVYNLPEEVMLFSTGYRGSRLGVSERGLFYKGVGTVYQGHNIYTENEDELLEDKELKVDEIQCPCSYIGYKVLRKVWGDKVGIFKEPYQPQFTDYIGGCGKKEIKIIQNSKDFSLSSPEIIGLIELMDDHKIYLINYKGGKVNNLDPHHLFKLIEVMLAENWNFPWDKNSCADINSAGLVTDTADIFKSDSLIHRFGSIYSILYSMKMNYPEIVNTFEKGTSCSLELSRIPFSVIKLLERFNQDVSAIDLYDEGSVYGYKFLMEEILTNGITCAHLEIPEFGEMAKQMYKDVLSKEFERQIVKGGSK